MLLTSNNPPTDSYSLRVCSKCQVSWSSTTRLTLSACSVSIKGTSVYKNLCMLIHLFPYTPVSRTLPWLLQSKNEFNVHTIYHMSNKPIKITYFLGMQTLLSAQWVRPVWTKCTFKLGQHYLFLTNYKRKLQTWVSRM